MRQGMLLGVMLIVSGVLPGRSWAAYLILEGYNGFSGSPQGGTIASVATGPSDPWVGAYAYTRVDGWNQAPRVDSSQYASGEWATGGHAGYGTQASGWASLDNSNPGRYAYDFEGFTLDSVTYDTDISSPTYGYEYRTYTGPGSWSLWDTVSNTSIASGSVNSLDIDVFHDPLNGFANPLITSRSVITVADDGSAFYNEMIGVFGTNQLAVNAVAPNEPPLQSVNPFSPLGQQWAIFDTYVQMEPLVPAAVPVPAAFWLFVSGLFGFIGIARRRKK